MFSDFQKIFSLSFTEFFWKFFHPPPPKKKMGWWSNLTCRNISFQPEAVMSAVTPTSMADHRATGSPITVVFPMGGWEGFLSVFLVSLESSRRGEIGEFWIFSLWKLHHAAEDVGSFKRLAEHRNWKIWHHPQHTGSFKRLHWNMWKMDRESVAS